MIKLLLILLISISLFAGEISRPEDFVRSIIEDCVDNKNIDNFVDFKKLSSNPRHPTTKESLVNKLKTLNLSKVTFEVNPKVLEQISGKKLAVVRMLSPINIDFELELRETGIEVKPYRWILISMHP